MFSQPSGLTDDAQSAANGGDRQLHEGYSRRVDWISLDFLESLLYEYCAYTSEEFMYEYNGALAQ